MIREGYTAIARYATSESWYPRVTWRNRKTFLAGTLATVTRATRDKSGRTRVRALIDGKVHTLHTSDWAFTSVRVGELRRWKDDRESPFLVIGIDTLGCNCLAPDGDFRMTYGYIEDFSEVISETR